MMNLNQSRKENERTGNLFNVDPNFLELPDVGFNDNDFVGMLE